MATGKRYYWIKLKESFMTSDTVDFFMSQKDGANYVVLYQMLCLKTINTDGRFARQIGDIIIPYDVSKIQRDCKWFSADTIRVALNLYKRFGLVYEDQDGVLVLANHDELVGSETDWAKQKRNQKKPQGHLPQHESGNEVESGVENFHTDNRDKRIDNEDDEEEGRPCPADSSVGNTENDIEEDPGMPFGLTDSEIKASIDRDRKIEDAARSVGLQVSEAGMKRGKDLAYKFGLEKLLEAIGKAVDVPRWDYVEGILKNDGTKRNDVRGNARVNTGKSASVADYSFLPDDDI